MDGYDDYLAMRRNAVVRHRTEWQDQVAPEHWPDYVRMSAKYRERFTPTIADSDWIARELGDVPHETITGWRSAAGTRTPWHGDCIPVESLGRDA